MLDAEDAYRTIQNKTAGQCLSDMTQWKRWWFFETGSHWGQDMSVTTCNSRIKATIYVLKVQFNTIKDFDIFYLKDERS